MCVCVCVCVSERVCVYVSVCVCMCACSCVKKNEERSQMNSKNQKGNRDGFSKLLPSHLQGTMVTHLQETYHFTARFWTSPFLSSTSLRTLWTTFFSLSSSSLMESLCSSVIRSLVAMKRKSLSTEPIWREESRGGGGGGELEDIEPAREHVPVAYA